MKTRPLCLFTDIRRSSKPVICKNIQNLGYQLIISIYRDLPSSWDIAKITFDKQVRLRYWDVNRFRLFDLFTCWAASETPTQFKFSPIPLLKKRVLIKSNNHNMWGSFATKTF